MTFLETDLSAEETATIARLRRELEAAGHPEIYPVDRATFETIENYYQRVQAEEVARWTAAGKPDDWPNPLWLTWTKTGNGLQFKGCELVMKLETEECLVHVPPCVRGDDGLWHQPGGEQPVRIDNIESRDRDVVIRGEKGWVE